MKHKYTNPSEIDFDYVRRQYTKSGTGLSHVRVPLLANIQGIIGKNGLTIIDLVHLMLCSAFGGNPLLNMEYRDVARSPLWDEVVSAIESGNLFIINDKDSISHPRLDRSSCLEWLNFKDPLLYYYFPELKSITPTTSHIAVRKDQIRRRKFEACALRVHVLDQTLRSSLDNPLLPCSYMEIIHKFVESSSNYSERKWLSSLPINKNENKGAQRTAKERGRIAKIIEILRSENYPIYFEEQEKGTSTPGTRNYA